MARVRVHRGGGGVLLGRSLQMTDNLILIRIWILDLAQLLLLSYKFRLASSISPGGSAVSLLLDFFRARFPGWTPFGGFTLGC